MVFPRLLAKSSRTPDRPAFAETLPGHLRHVTRVACLLVERSGKQYLTSLGLNTTQFEPMLRAALPRAAFAHDLGKANDHFQRMLGADPTLTAQAARHEQIGLWLLLHDEDLSTWLFDGCGPEIRHMVLTAVLGHHLRAERGDDVGALVQSGSLSLTVLAAHPDFRSALDAGVKLLHLTTPPMLTDSIIDLVMPDTYKETLMSWLLDADSWWRSLSQEERRFVAALKVLLIAVDGAGSAVPRMPADPAQWAANVLDQVCECDALEALVQARLHGAAPRPFQRLVADTPCRVTFVQAGCGTGKTAAAYLWASQRAAGRKLFFCYPTTGTASQGFVDYVPPEQADAALVHSRAAADLEDLLSNGAEDARDRIDWLLRYLSLASWRAPLTVCTVDTVLGLIQNNRMGVFSFPAIANGAFVFDEIHLFDEALFGALLRFLDTFRQVPVLLMTASLPRSRRIALEAVTDNLGESLGIVEGPPEFEALPRYRLQQSSVESAWQQVVETVARGGRVLWVSNTVPRAIQFAQRAAERGLPTLPYHSRYRYQDRLQRHADVVSAFAGEASVGRLAVTTQVCEVSLDLSADLLVSDLAPVPALIQRLGRLNRRSTPDAPTEPTPALILTPPYHLPYEEQDLDVARDWLRYLGTGPVSQADLSSAFQVTHEGEAPCLPVRSAWLDSGVLSPRASLREAGTTIPVMREEDSGGLHGMRFDHQKGQIVRLTIPMPVRDVATEIGAWNRLGGTLIAPEGRLQYDEQFGAHWR
jgi:CRISPR-associated endonuclease/helicase Cas3